MCRIWLICALVMAGCAARAQGLVDEPVLRLKGGQSTLGEFTSAGPTLVTFWATWCGPCRQELRALQDLYEKYHPRGFTVFAINQDSPRSLAKVRAYVASQGFTFPVGLDPNGQVLQRFNGQEIPLSILLDTNGTSVYRSMGYLPGDENVLEDTLQRFLSASR